MKVIIVLFAVLLTSCAHSGTGPHKYKFTCTDGHVVYGDITQEEIKESFKDGTKLFDKIARWCNEEDKQR